MKEQVEERLRFYDDGIAPTKNVTAMQARHGMRDATQPSFPLADWPRAAGCAVGLVHAQTGQGQPAVRWAWCMRRLAKGSRLCGGLSACASLRGCSTWVTHYICLGKKKGTRAQIERSCELFPLMFHFTRR